MYLLFYLLIIITQFPAINFLQSLKGIVKNSIIQSPTILADQVREILYEGQLLLSEEERTTSLKAFLFSDILLLTKVKKDPKKSRMNVRTTFHSVFLPQRYSYVTATATSEPYVVTHVLQHVIYMWYNIFMTKQAEA